MKTSIQKTQHNAFAWRDRAIEGNQKYLALEKRYHERGELLLRLEAALGKLGYDQEAKNELLEECRIAEAERTISAI